MKLTNLLTEARKPSGSVAEIVKALKVCLPSFKPAKTKRKKENTYYVGRYIINLVAYAEKRYELLDNLADKLLKYFEESPELKISRTELGNSSGSITIEDDTKLIAKIQVLLPSDGKTNGTDDELHQVSRINTQLDKIKDEVGVDEIPIINGKGKVVWVHHFTKTPNNPKSDIEGQTADNTSVMWISCKKAGTANSFQSYAGVSARNEPVMNELSLKFINELKRILKQKNSEKKRYQLMLYPTEYFRSSRPCPKVTQMKAIFGRDYGNELGVNNCDYLCQGNISINPTGKTAINVEGIAVPVYQPVASSFNLKNGQSISDNTYVPYFGAHYANRDGEGIKNCRLGIFPFEFFVGAKNLTLIEN